MDLKWLLSFALVGCKLAACINYNDDIFVVKDGSISRHFARELYDEIIRIMLSDELSVTQCIENFLEILTSIKGLVDDGQINTEVEYDTIIKILSNTKDDLGYIKNYIEWLPKLAREVDDLKSQMQEQDRRTLGEDLTMRVKTLTAGKRELEEKLKMELEYVTAKVDALPIKKEITRKRIKALAQELENCEIHIKESESMILKGIVECIEKLLGSKTLTNEEHHTIDAEIFVMRMLLAVMEGAMETVENIQKEIEELKIGMTKEESQILDHEIMQHTAITTTETKELIEILRKEVLDIEKGMEAKPIKKTEGKLTTP
ncbi:hypothetical protein BdWA1_001504 [Babesia duncani]|uniref:Uncharacterized protein n=1 Tax=Babesia duncani TaxID=323732 RepID=A0AAD9PKR8_9APIC|nr:hypothetical protein BdWA1_001504 [Babesia duncani]